MPPKPIGPRIIAGSLKGRKLATPAGLDTRPTLGRVRESLFMILTPRLHGARVLDLCAGSGALGIEAISRGAAALVAVEQARAAQAVLLANARQFNIEKQVKVVDRDAVKCCTVPGIAGEAPFDVILLDPPYAQGMAAQMMEAMARHPQAWLAEGGVIAAQVGKADAMAGSYGPWTAAREERYGATRVIFYEQQAPRATKAPT